MFNFIKLLSFGKFFEIYLLQCIPNFFGWRHTFRSKFSWFNLVQKMLKIEFHDLFSEHEWRKVMIWHSGKISRHTWRFSQTTGVSRHIVWNSLIYWDDLEFVCLWRPSNFYIPSPNFHKIIVSNCLMNRLETCHRFRNWVLLHPKS